MEDISDATNFNISYIHCNNKNPIQLFCLNQHCTDNFIICQKDECQCHTKFHKKCRMMKASRLYEKVNSKKGSIGKQFQQTINKVIQIYDQAIDSLSRERQHMTNCIKNYGLTLSEIIFIEKIQNNSLNELSKDQFMEVVYNSKKQKILNVNMIYEELSNGWKQKKNQLIQFFKFRDSKFFTIFDQNQLVLEEFQKDTISKKLQQIDKKSLKNLTIRYFGKEDKLHQYIISLVSQCKNLQKLSLSNFNCRLSLLLKTVKQLPLIKQLVLQKWDQFRSQIPQITQILQLQHLKKLSMIKDIQYSLQKRYQQQQFFDNSVDQKKFSLNKQIQLQILSRQQYWQCCLFGKAQHNLTKLKHLSIQNIVFQDFNITLKQVIPKIQNLVSLRIHQCDNIFYRKKTAAWQVLSSLKRLIISQCQYFETEDLALICHNCRNLEDLVLDKVIPDVFSYYPIKKLIKLQTLSLQMAQKQNDVERQQIYNLQSLFANEQKMQQLISQQLTEQSSWLRELTNLRTLNLKNNSDFTFHWLPNIRKLKSLQFISLNCPEEGAQNLICLRRLTRLKTLILQGLCPYEILSKILQKTKKLTKLKIDNQINYTREILAEVQSLKHLEYLSAKINTDMGIKIDSFLALDKLKYLQVDHRFDSSQISKMKSRGIKVDCSKKIRRPTLDIVSEPDLEFDDWGLF